ncbi:MAG: hypothetical protein IT520_10030 [Burkholderiales bacterium]|nr:hypothetical protein [Burkholderiales bacterium]
MPGVRFPGFFAALAAAFLSGCAGMGGLSADSPVEAKKAAVAAKAEARGAALVRGDLDTAYALLSEGSKAVISRDNFGRRMTVVPFTAYRIESVTCEADTCQVRSKLTYNHRTMKGVTTPVTEVWVIERGQPFFVFPTG